MHQAEQILIDEGAFLPQAEREVHYLIDDDVKDVTFFYCCNQHRLGICRHCSRINSDQNAMN